MGIVGQAGEHKRAKTKLNSIIGLFTPKKKHQKKAKRRKNIYREYTANNLPFHGLNVFKA